MLWQYEYRVLISVGIFYYVWDFSCLYLCGFDLLLFEKVGGQGDNFEQNRVLEHQNNCQYALKILLILHRDESLKNSPGYQAATVS